MIGPCKPNPLRFCRRATATKKVMMVTTSPQPSLRSARHPKNAQLIALIAMASFGMLFGTLLLSFLLAQARNTNWPPIGVQPVNSILAFLSTGVIISSSLVYTHARKSSSKWWFLGTWCLAWIFLALQYETLKTMWVHGQSLNSDIYSGSVHLLIGMHALHLLAGIAALSYVAAMSFWRPAKLTESTTQIVGWFWHFLGFLWALIFLVLVL